MEPIAGWNRLRDLFEGAARLTGEPRERFVAQSCGDDEELRARLEALLRAHESASGFLASRAEDPVTADTVATHSEEPGAMIGPYKLLQRIGEGGFGVVYMAEQQSPIVRRVALKVIKPGMDSSQVLARFEAERQALALMDHPNIAQVLDAGATESGRPYFVMELVKGLPITDYCDQQLLDNRRRLEVFLDVLRAVQHAHQKGIIHRDLKPSNVLVTTYDGVATPKVIDFGIAKATAMRLTERSLFTEYGQFVGTPAYMSPEQAAISGQDVDTRSDIYSLGAMLYELLTGQKPIAPERLRSLAFLELLRVIREEEPVRPSTRVSSEEDVISQAAEQRGLAPAQFARALRGEPDWIVMKALAKDRTRRYASAGEFAADIERYLNAEPVSAGPPGIRYRTGRFLRRHRVAAGVTAVVAISLAASTFVATIGLVRARKAEAVARRQARVGMLELEAQRALQPTGTRLFGDLDQFVSKTREAIGVLREAEHESPHELTIYLANLVTSLDRETQFREVSGDRDGRDVLLAEIQSEALQRMMALETPVDSSYLVVLDGLTRVAMRRSPDHVVPLLRRALEVRRKTALLDSAYAATATRLAIRLRAVADSLVAAGEAVRAEPMLVEALRGLLPATSLAPHAVGEAKGSLGACISAQGRCAEAESLLVSAWQLAGTAGVLEHLVALQRRCGNQDSARRLADLAIVDQVRDLGTLEVDGKEITRDLGYSTRLGRRSLWLFSKTFEPLSPVFSHVVHSNAQVWSDDFDARDGIRFSGAGSDERLWRQFIARTALEIPPSGMVNPPPAPGHQLWPGPLLHDPARRRVFIAYAKGDGGDRWIGSSIAVLRENAAVPARPEVRPGTAEPTLLFQGLEPWLSAAGVVFRDTLYLYGKSRDAGNPTVVARAPLASALDRGAWRFWAGNGRWATNWSAAAGVIRTGPHFSVHWNAHLRRFLAVISAEDCDGLELRVADRPEGPWSPRLVVLPPVARDVLADTTARITGEFTEAGAHIAFSVRPHDYAAMAHPELSREGGRVEYVTFNRPVDAMRSSTRLLEITLR